MEWFSGKYKKMCEKAERLQQIWIPQDWDYYYRKGDYEDGYSITRVSLKSISEPIEEWKESHTWLPLDIELEERVLRREINSIDNLTLEKYYKYREEVVDEIKNEFKEDEVLRVIALMFAMRYRFKQVWNDEEGEWIRKV